VLLQLSLWVTGIEAFYPFLPKNLAAGNRHGASRRTDADINTDNEVLSRTHAEADGPVSFNLRRSASTEVSPTFVLQRVNLSLINSLLRPTSRSQQGYIG
jgi:hypothetical protein